MVRAPDHSYAVPTRIVSSTPGASGSVAIDAALTAYDRVLADVGANFPMRDAVDTRVIGEVQSCPLGEANLSNCAGRHPTLADLSPASWPALDPGIPPVDTDNDGMPDSWERANLGGSLDQTANGDFNGDGYDNIENYFNGLVSADAPPAAPPVAPILLD